MSDEEMEPREGDWGGIFRGSDGQWYLARCPRCRRENYGPAVATGRCVWCGSDAGAADGEAKR